MAKQIEARNAQVVSGADPSTPGEFNVPRGTDLWVLDKQNGFHAVTGSEGRTAWMTVANVKPKLLSPDAVAGDSEARFVAISQNDDGIGDADRRLQANV